MALQNSETLISRRHILFALGTTGCGLLYILRLNLSVAIVAMVKMEMMMTKLGNNTEMYDLCYVQETSTVMMHENTGEYDWSESFQGIILGAYFYSYCVTQIAGGRLAERWGAKWVCAVGVFVPAIFNALIPIGLKLHVSTLIILRLLMGAFHGVVISALVSMYTKWFPKNELSIPMAGTIFGGNIGCAISVVLTGYLCKSNFLNGWPSAFYVTSAIHIIWFLLWCWLIHNTPEEHPTISQQELCHIKENIHSKTSANSNIKIPWMAIMSSTPVWASIVTKACISYAYFVLCTKLPKYLESVLGLALRTNSWFNAFMYLSLCVSLIFSGPLSNYIISKNWFTRIRVRKIFQSIANIGSGVCLILIPLVGCDKPLVIALLLIGIFFSGFFSGGEHAVLPEYAADLSGTVFGVAYTVGSATGFIGPLVVGILIESGMGGRHQWNIVWYIAGTISLFGALIFELFGSATPQQWAVLSNNKHNENKSNNDETKSDKT